MSANFENNAAGLDPTFVKNMQTLLGDETEAFFRALENAPALSLRINSLRAGAERVAARYCGEAVPWAANGRYILPGARPGASISHFAGAFYIQEASAMLPAAILGARPGEKILDLCAAPGGKSSQMAAELRGEGLLISNEPDLKRARMLAGNLERLGVKNALVVSEYPPKLAEKWPDFFDAIMVDAPCSGEGMFRRDPDSRAQWRPASPEGCAQRQLDILDSAAKMLAPGGRIVYSTCTYNDVEDEGVVEKFLAVHPEFSLAPFSVGGLGERPSGMAKIWPHIYKGDGQFAALFVKAGSRPCARREKKPSPARSKNDPAPELYRKFIGEFANPGENFRPALWGDTLFAAPVLAPDTSGLRVISPGLALAKALKGRFEPAHQLAMAIDTLEACALTDCQALAYARGEEVPCQGRGWLAVRHNGLPLGWGKASGGVLKNHLPKGLRRNLEL